MNVLSLFSGIGGLDLGLERAGMTVVGQVEIDPWCRKVLAKHWPEVPRHDDVRTAVEWWGGRRAPDLVAGGFPCQPVSYSGQRGAQDDSRWLWPAMATVVRGLRPRFVLVENVIGLSTAGLGDVLGDLAAFGFDAEWGVLSACAVGAPHSRERLFIVADAGSERQHGREGVRGTRRQAPVRQQAGGNPRNGGSSRWSGWWAAEPGVGRVAARVPARVDRLRGLGNAVVPQVAEHLGRMILGTLEAAS
jgi:DNA (cytosine-5)-methyltransferase 1